MATVSETFIYNEIMKMNEGIMTALGFIKLKEVN